MYSRPMDQQGGAGPNVGPNISGAKARTCEFSYSSGGVGETRKRRRGCYRGHGSRLHQPLRKGFQTSHPVADGAERSRGACEFSREDSEALKAATKRKRFQVIRFPILPTA